MMHEHRWWGVVLSALAVFATGIVIAQNAEEDGVIVQEEIQRDAAINGEATTAAEGEKVAEEASAPAEQAKTEEAPAEEVKAEAAPAEDAPVAAAPAEEVKAEEAVPPADEAKAAEGTGESVQKLAEEALGAADGEAAPVPEEGKAPEGETVSEVKEETPVAEAPASEEVKKEAPAAAPVAEEVKEETPVVPVPEDVKKEKPAAPPPPVAKKPVIEETKTIDETAEQAVKEAVSEGIPKPPAVPPAKGTKVVAQPVDPRAAEIAVIRDSEVLKRKAYEKHAQETTKEAEKSLGNKKYAEAIGLFEEAMKTYRQIAERPGEQVERQRTKRGLAETYYRYATVLLEQREFDTAEDFAKKANASGHAKAPALLERIQKEKTKPAPIPKVSKTTVWDAPDKVQTEKDISGLMTDGLQYMQAGDFDKAQEMFDRVMKRDPYNTEAMRMLRKVGQKKLDRARMEREATRKDLVADVVKTWNPRDYGITEGFEPGVENKGKPVPTVDPQREKILKKMDAIKIPEIDFRQANIHDVVNFLQGASGEYDTSGDEGKSRGINIILNLQTEGAGAGAAAPAAAAPAEPAFGDEAPAGDAGAGASSVPLVTFSARYISLLEALNIVTKVAGLKYRIEGSVVMIVPLDAAEGALIHRMYDVLPTLVEKIQAARGEMAAGGGEGGDFKALEATPTSTEKSDLKEFFTALGVPWPAQSKIKHIPSIGKLIVVNTADNIAIFEGILSVLNVVPNQIEIEARFVEIKQLDFDSLGFEWLLNSDWTLAQKKGQENLPLSQRERIVMSANAGSGGFTTGNRYVSDAAISPQYMPFFDTLVGQVSSGSTLADDLFTISGVLTDPQLSMVLHALEQKGNADVLSAPKVTTQSGAEATIKVVTEYIYPTEYTVTPVTATVNGQSTVIGGIVEPGGFETREVGVILQVLPEVTTDGSMINLTMTPQVVSDPVWHDYGSTYTANNQTQRLKMEMPFFHTRTITTSISIFNGATVVMGGMITENRNDVEDKIPFLGDIPLLGRLFTSRIEHSEKNNLLIFVTARQVDPAGRVLKRGVPGLSGVAAPAAAR